MLDVSRSHHQCIPFYPVSSIQHRVSVPKTQPAYVYFQCRLKRIYAILGFTWTANLLQLGDLPVKLVGGCQDQADLSSEIGECVGHRLFLGESVDHDVDLLSGFEQGVEDGLIVVSAGPDQGCDGLGGVVEYAGWW